MKGVQYRGGLTASQAAAGINAASKNAERLLRDARILFEAGRYPSAISLAVLAMEEAGKPSIIDQIAAAQSDGERNEGWRSYRSHKAKTVLAGVPELVWKGARKLEDFLGLFKKNARHTHFFETGKQAGFYTDCIREGEWVEPDKVFGKKAAASVLRVAGIVVNAGRRTTAQEMEIYIEHMGPVARDDHKGKVEALIRFYDELQARGLRPEGPNPMRQFFEEGAAIDDTEPNL